MTRDEAVKEIKVLRKRYVINAQAEDIDSAFGTFNALGIAITALSGPTRGQVEKLRGEWIGDNDEKVETIDGSPLKSATCSVCGNWLVGSSEYYCSGHFCPACGSPMTDEAVDILLKRLEALKDGTI